MTFHACNKQHAQIGLRVCWLCKIVLLWIITLLNMSLYYIVRCCTTLKEMTQDIMLHCEKLHYTARCYVPTLISCSPKLPLVFLELYGNTNVLLFSFSNLCLKSVCFIAFRPFRLTCAIARVSTHTKSHIRPEKVLFIEYSSFNPSFMFTSAVFE